MTKMIFALAAALALAATPATAQWYGPGSNEPDHALDTSSYMWSGPDTTPGEGVKQVYFNAYQVQYLANVNPNSAELGTHFTSPVVHIRAMLGIWKDCNGDGFVGHYESAMLEYRAELLLDDSVCESGTMFNDGSWVFEFIHLGPHQTLDDGAQRYSTNVINATGAAIWGDLGLPGTEPGFSCPLNPPSGTTSRTGALLRWLDCPSGNSVVKGVNTIDSDGELGLAFADPKNPQHSDSALNQEAPYTLWGNPYTGQTGLIEDSSDDEAFRTWDCAGEPAASAEDPTGGDLHGVGVEDPTGELGDLEDDNGNLFATVNVSDEDGVIQNVYSPAPTLANPTGSYKDGVNQTERGLIHDCDPESQTETQTLVNNPEGALESTGQAAPGKNAVGSWFTFNDGQAMRDNSVRPNVATVPDVNYGGALAGILGQNTPTNLGVPATAFQLTSAGWSSNTIITSEEFYVTPESGPTDQRFFTFYSYVPEEIVSQFGLSLPAGSATHVYGSDNCGFIGEGAETQTGWACDPDLWYIDNAGNPREAEADRTRVGDPYQMRDVDCFNGLPVVPFEDQSSWC